MDGKDEKPFSWASRLAFLHKELKGIGERLPKNKQMLVVSKVLDGFGSTLVF